MGDLEKKEAGEWGIFGGEMEKQCGNGEESEGRARNRGQKRFDREGDMDSNRNVINVTERGEESRESEERGDWGGQMGRGGDRRVRGRNKKRELSPGGIFFRTSSLVFIALGAS